MRKAQSLLAFELLANGQFSAAAGLVTYIDTVQLNTSWGDAVNTRRYLLSQEVKAVITKSKNPFAPALLRIHQLPKQSVHAVHILLNHYYLNRFDLAFDFLFEGEPSARMMGAFLQKHLTQRWRGFRTFTRAQGTVYFGSAWCGRNAVLYHDRPSKSRTDAATPCAHLELRLTGAHQMRRLGLPDLRALYHLDSKSLLLREFRLSHLDRAAAERKILKVAGGAVRRGIVRTRDEGVTKIKSIMTRALAVDENGWSSDDLFDIPVQVWLDRCRAYTRQSVRHVPLPLRLIKTLG